MSDGMNRNSIANRMKCIKRCDPRDCVFCEAAHFLDTDAKEIDRLSTQNKEFELAALTAISNKERAENNERLARVEIDRLNALIVNARSRFDDIAASASTQSQERIPDKGEGI